MIVMLLKEVTHIVSGKLWHC